MFTFNADGTYRRNVSREEEIEWLAENRGEKREQEKIAKSMIKDKMSLKKIKQYTGLTEKVIRSMML